MKKIIFIAAAALAMSACGPKQTVSTVDRMTHDPNATNTETILHVWSWNFNTITENMKQMVQSLIV